MRLINILLKGFLLITIASFFSSCSYMQVKYSFEKDGSGTMEMGAEMGQAMKMIQMMSAMEDSEDEGGSGDPMADLFKNMDGQMDTIINMADVMPDSLRGTPEGDAMKYWKLRMTADPESQEMYMAMETEFDKISQLKDRMAAMEGMNSGGMDMSSGSPIPDDYFTNDMIFTGKSLKIAAYKMPEGEKSVMEEAEEEDPMVSQMMGNMSVRLVYEVPGKIKKVKYKGPWKLIDDYTVLVEYSMEEFDAIKVFPPMQIKWK